MSADAKDANQPHLKRVLGRWDLVLLFVVAVFNLNVVPSIAANGGVTVWLWIISLLLFFWPQGIAVDVYKRQVNTPTVQPTPDAVEEFRVITNTFDAEYGRNSGSVVLSLIHICATARCDPT